MDGIDYIKDYILIIAIYLASFTFIFLINYLLGSSRLIENRRRKIFISVFSLIVLFITYKVAKTQELITFYSPQNEHLFFLSIQSFAWIFSAYLIDNLIDFFIWNGVLIDEGKRIVPKIITMVFSALLYSATIALILHYVFAKDTIAIISASGILAFIVGYSAKGILSEVFAGISLNVNRYFKVGDFIQIDGGVKGFIRELNWRSVIVGTTSNTYVVIANTDFCKSRVTNFSQPNNITKTSFEICVDSRHHPSEVMPIIVQALHDEPSILQEPEPWIEPSEITAINITYFIKFAVNEPTAYYYHRPVLISLYSRFKREGIKFSAKGSIKMSADATSSYNDLRGKFDQNDFVDCIQSNQVLKNLNKEQVLSLLPYVKHEKYYSLERVIIEGEKGSSLFIVSSGELHSYSYDSKLDKEIKIRTYKRGNIFGLKSLFLGENRRITVRGDKDNSGALVYEIEREAFTEIFKSNPKLVEDFSALLSARELKYEEIKAKSRNDQENLKNSKKSMAAKFLNQMKSLFNLNSK